MNSEVRIPTLLGLGVLLAGLVGGMLMVTTNQTFKSRAGSTASPKNVTLANISRTGASIYWQTDQPATGFIQAGPTTALGGTYRDDRDSGAPQTHALHFITLTNLTPDTLYYYKIGSGDSTYPSGEPYSFKTAAQDTTPSGLQPLIGTILDSETETASEAIVTLQLPGSQTLAAVAKAGNFILPLIEIRNENLENLTVPQTGINSKLIAFNGTKRSEVIVPLPYSATTIPPIILGRDFDLSQITLPSPTPFDSRYDLNNDGVINSHDLSTVIKNQGKNPKDKRADLNDDKVVDQKDIDLIQKFIPNILPQ